MNSIGAGTAWDEPEQVGQKTRDPCQPVGYHIRRLATIGLVETKPATQGREQLCFATGDAHLWNDKATRVLYGRGLPRKVAIYLVKHPGADVHEIARGLSESEHTVRRHVKTLQEYELVARTQVRKRVHYHPESRLEEWVELVRKDYGGFCEADSGKCWKSHALFLEHLVLSRIRQRIRTRRRQARDQPE